MSGDPLRALDAMFARANGVSLTDELPGRTGIADVVKMTPRTGKDADGTSWTVWNVSVRPLGGKFAPEDETYRKFPVLFRRVPRVFVVQQSKSDPGVMETVLTGLTKFEALSAIDDDDHVNDTTTTETETEPTGAGKDADTDTVSGPPMAALCNPTTGARVGAVFAYQKCNGHMWVAHAGPDGRVYAGTKNCIHALEHLGRDLSSVSFPSAMVAEVFVRLQTKFLGSADGGAALMAALRAEVLVGEMETNQHLVYHTAPDMVVFNSSPATDGLFAKPRVQGPWDPARATTWHTWAELRSGYNTEGVVLACVESPLETAAVTDPVCLRLKFKTVWYIVVRTLREMYKDDDNLVTRKRKLLERILRHNNYMLVDPDQLMAIYNMYLCPLLDFMHARGVARRTIAFDGEGFAPVLEQYRRHVLSRPSPPDLEALFTMPNRQVLASEVRFAEASELARRSAATASDRRRGRGRDSASASGSSSGLRLGPASASARADAGLVLACASMPPGTGKTTLMKDVARRLGGSTAGGMFDRVVDMSQDQFRDANGFRAALADAVKDAPCVCVHRCNFEPGDRRRITETAVQAGKRMVYVEPEEDPQGLDMLYVSLRGVLQEDRKSHPTLGAKARLPPWKLMLIASGFWVGVVRVSEAREPGVEVIRVRMLQEGRAPLPASIMDLLQPFSVAMRRRNTRFALQTLPDDLGVDVHALVKALQGGPEIRRPTSDIAGDVVAHVSSLVAGGAGVGGAGVSGAGVSGAGVGGKAGAGGAGVGSKTAACDDPMPCFVQYVGLFVRPALTQYLDLLQARGLLPAKGPGASMTVSADHVTLAFQPSPRDVATLYKPILGQTFKIRVKAIHVAHDGTLAALEVAVPDLPPAIARGVSEPHITLAWKAGKRRPVDSAALVAGKLCTREVVPLEDEDVWVSGVVDFAYPTNRRRS